MQNGLRMLAVMLVVAFALGFTFPALAEDTPETVDYEQAILKAQAEKAQAEAEKAKAEAEKAKAEAEKAKAEAEKAKAEAPTSAAQKTQPEQPAPEAEAAAVDENAHRHDGFFLRMGLGLGYVGFSASGSISMRGFPSLSSPSQHSFGSGFELSIGGCPQENLAIHANLMATTPWDFNHSPTDYLFSGYGIGLGITKYFMPENIFVTGAVGVAGAAIIQVKDMQNVPEGEPIIPESELDRHVQGGGPYLSLMVGKEWWVSENWGLGVALRAQYGYAYMNRDVSIHHGHVLATFTATYN